jgi:hypothetical protein
MEVALYCQIIAVILGGAAVLFVDLFALSLENALKTSDIGFIRSV